MTAPAHHDNEAGGVSVFAVANVMLRHRRLIASLGLIGGLVGGLAGLFTRITYRSAATFFPQSGDATASNLAGLASQFGLRVPSAASDGWSAAVYAALLKSRTMLEPIALDTLVVPELDGKRIAVMDLLDIDDSKPALRPELTVRALDKLIQADDDPKLNLVNVSAKTRWASVSKAFVDRLVKGINEFNLETRQSQAGAERAFADRQAAQAEQSLREAEDSLLQFQQRNRIMAGAASLMRDRLDREVQLRHQVYTTILQSREEARIRAVRDVPVITVIEPPRLPVRREPRGTIKKGILGGVAGLFLGVLVAFIRHRWQAADRSSDPEEVEFQRLVRVMMPLRRSARGA